MIAFAVGPSDAETLAEQLAGDLKADDLLTLPRIAPTSVSSSMVARAVRSRWRRCRRKRPEPTPAAATASAGYSRQRYARPAAQVEREIHATFAAR